MTRIAVTVTHDDGSIITCYAENPVHPRIQVTTPGRSDLGLSDLEAPFMIAVPELTQLTISMEADLGHPITCEVAGATGPAAPVTVRRDDLDSVYEYARQFHKVVTGAVDDEPAMTRIASMLHFTRPPAAAASKAG